MREWKVVRINCVQIDGKSYFKNAGTLPWSDVATAQKLLINELWYVSKMSPKCLLRTSTPVEMPMNVAKSTMGDE